MGRARTYQPGDRTERLPDGRCDFARAVSQRLAGEVLQDEKEGVPVLDNGCQIRSREPSVTLSDEWELLPSERRRAALEVAEKIGDDGERRRRLQELFVFQHQELPAARCQGEIEPGDVRKGAGEQELRRACAELRRGLEMVLHDNLVKQFLRDRPAARADRQN